MSSLLRLPAEGITENAYEVYKNAKNEGFEKQKLPIFCLRDDRR
jgi:hypothetical protein